MYNFFKSIKRSLICMKSAFKDSARIPLLIIYVSFLTFGLTRHGDISDILLVLVLFGFVIDILFTIVIYALDRSHYGLTAFHKYDDEIIGDNFIGFRKKDKCFAKAMEYLFAKDVKKAVDIFLEIKDMEISQSEKSVVYFYIARCYQLMGYFSNALTNYENAADAGFRNDLLPIFMARCSADMGETERAVEFYTSALNEENRYASIIRTDIGRMYLIENDGKNALKWFLEAVEKHEDYSNALGGCAIAYTLLHDLESGEDYYKKALLNKIPNSKDFTSYYKEIQAAVILDGKPLTHKQGVDKIV